MHRSIRRAPERGFTLTELFVVVLIVGIMATLAVYGVRKYVLASKTTEAVSLMTSIKSAEEAYRDETFQYLDVSGSYANLYPMAAPADLGTKKYAWATNRTDAVANGWRTLGVEPDGPVYYGYAVVARPAGTAVPSPTPPVSKSWTFPTTEPAYLVLAQGDLDGDGKHSLVVSHSLSNEVYVENEGE